MAAKKKKASKSIAVKAAASVKGSDRVDQLRVLAEQCNKALGASGAVYLGTEQRPFERVPSGIKGLDYVLGGGLVRGQMVQFTGADGSFKTTAALIATAAVQQAGGTVVWVAGEGFSKKWALGWGVDLERLLLITADTGDVAMETAVTLMQSGLVDLMVMDSFQSLGTTREMEAGVDDESYAGAGAPQMWGRVMRKVYASMNQGANTAIVGISQVRSPIGKYGVTEPEGSGIWALKHWKAADVYFRKGEQDLEGDASEKRRLKRREFKLRCIKNKTAASERQASFNLVYDDEGVPTIDNVGTLFRLAKAYELIDVRGAWFEGYGIRAQGEERFLRELRDDEDTQNEMWDDLMQLV